MKKPSEILLELINSGLTQHQAGLVFQMYVQADKEPKTRRRSEPYGPSMPPWQWMSEEKWRAYDYAQTSPAKPGAFHDRLQGREWAALVKLVLSRDGFTCTYCGAKPPFKLHCDHIVPLARGGSNDPENLTTACEYCNCSKGDKLPLEWDVPFALMPEVLALQ